MASKPTLTDEQKQQLLDKQFAQAMNGDSQLLIHLGATQLGQVKESRLSVESLPIPTQSYDDLLDIIEDRMREAGLVPTAFQLASNAVITDERNAQALYHDTRDGLALPHDSNVPDPREPVTISAADPVVEDVEDQLEDWER